MHSTRSSTHLARSLQIALVAVLTLFPLVSGGATAQHGDVSGRAALGQSGQVLLDLAAMTLRPDDLMDAGVETKMGVSTSVLVDDATEARKHIGEIDTDPASEDPLAFEEADAERYYILDLDNSSFDEAEDMDIYTQVVQTFVLEYDDEDDAAGGLDAMKGVWAASDALDEEALSEVIGDDAFYLEGEGVDNYTMEPTERTLLVFQVDNIVAGVLTYNSDADGSLDQDVTEELGLTMIGRVEDGLEGDIPGLSNSVVRLDRPATEVWSDAYMTIDGDIICWAITLDMGECDSYQTLVDDYNEIDRYYLYTRIAGDFDGAPQSFVSNSVRTFQDETSAEARYDEYYETYAAAAPDVEDLDLGDESARWSESTENYTYEYVLVRSGDTIIEIGQATEFAAAKDLGWTFEPSVDGVLEIADLQIACLEGETSCAEPIAIPDGMLPAEAVNAFPAPGGATITALPERRAA